MKSYFQCLPIKIFRDKRKAEQYRKKVLKIGFNAIVFQNNSEYYVQICNYLNEETKLTLIKNLEYYGFSVIK
jgi:hypothetical protein